MTDREMLDDQQKYIDKLEKKIDELTATNLNLTRKIETLNQALTELMRMLK